nr:hypothetical protein [Tanacetum cinerariifolium]
MNYNGLQSVEGGATSKVVLAFTSFLLFCISSVVIATVLAFFFAELSLVEPVPNSSRGACLKCKLLQQGQLRYISSGNTSSLAVAKYSSSGNFITGRDAFQNNSEDSLTSAMMLLARAITQRFFNPTNNCLCTSSNTKNHEIMQADRVNIQSKNSGNDGKNTRQSYVQEEIIEDASRMEEVKELSANICLMARIQPVNLDFDARPSYDSAFLSEEQQPSTSDVNPLFAKDNQEQKYPKQPKIINDTIGDDQN